MSANDMQIMDSSTGLISGTVASGDSANGPYSVTVTATDSQGNSSAQQFNWTINAPSNALTLTNPGKQSNAEGDNVSLQLSATSPGGTLTYSASGLSINSGIGLISGTLANSDASSTPYTVMVTDLDGNVLTGTQPVKQCY